jgi:molybdenum cofactor cytidylyltransferase
VASLGSKPLLRCGGMTFIELIVEKLILANIHSVIIVTNRMLKDKVRNLKLPARIVINPNPKRGMLSSLVCGLKIVPKTASGILMNPVDFPLVETATYQEMKKLHEQNSNHIIKPIYEGKSGHPVIFPSHLFAALEDAPLDQGARFVVRKFSHLIKTMDTSDQGIVLNINTPEMYEKWCVN